MKDSIVWISILYSDCSQIIFRGTQNRSIIQDCCYSIPNMDVFQDDNYLKNNVIFNVRTKRFLIIDSDCKVTEYKSKPEYNRRIDKFVSNFI